MAGSLTVAVVTLTTLGYATEIELSCSAQKLTGENLRVVWGQVFDFTGSAKANRREPKTCLGRVFNYKLDCFNDVHVLIYVDAHPHFYLKTQPRFSPVS